MIPPLMLADPAGGAARHADEWFPTEMPGLALARWDRWWSFTHIRSGLSVGYHPDRDYLVEYAVPVLKGTNWTRPAEELVRDPKVMSCRFILVLLGLQHPTPRPGLHARDIDQDPRLAPLSGVDR